MSFESGDISGMFTSGRNVQANFLPSDIYIKQIIPDCFILYLPKDVVTGDFYWIERVNDTVLFAVADCTGHAIQGAILSALCFNALTRSLKDFGAVIPGHILDRTKDIILKDHWKGQQIQDGMDIALCSITANTLKYAGANNPAYIIRNGKLIELQPNKQPVGYVDCPVPFLTQEFDLVSGDVIYIFSDGFSDQFGGERDKKYTSKRFKELLKNTSGHAMEEQKKILEQEFRNWKGKGDQFDDVCVMGVRIH